MLFPKIITEMAESTKSAKAQEKMKNDLLNLLPDGVILSQEITDEQVNNAVAHFNALNEQKLNELKAEVAEANASNEELKAQLVELSSQLSVAAKVGNKPSFQYEGKTYTVAHGATVKVGESTQRYSAKEIADNAAIQAVLVAQKSGAIKEVA